MIELCCSGSFYSIHSKQSQFYVKTIPIPTSTRMTTTRVVCRVSVVPLHFLWWLLVFRKNDRFLLDRSFQSFPKNSICILNLSLVRDSFTQLLYPSKTYHQEKKLTLTRLTRLTSHTLHNFWFFSLFVLDFKKYLGLQNEKPSSSSWHSLCVIRCSCCILLVSWWWALDKYTDWCMYVCMYVQYHTGRSVVRGEKCRTLHGTWYDDIFYRPSRLSRVPNENLFSFHRTEQLLHPRPTQ